MFRGCRCRIDLSFAHDIARHEFRVPAEQNIGTAAGHVGCDRDLSFTSGLRDDLGLFLVILGVQYDVFDTGALQHGAELFRTIDGDRADQCRLALFGALLDLFDNGFEFLALGSIDDVGLLDAPHLAIRGNDGDVEFIDFPKFFRFGFRSTGHAGKLLVHAEIILEGDRRERLVFLLDAESLFGFDSLMKTITPAASRHQAAGELIDNDDLAFLHDILDIALVQRVRAQRLVDVVQDFHVRHVGKIIHGQKIFAAAEAFFGQCHGAVLFIDLIIDIATQFRDDFVDAVVLVGRFIARTGNDERCPRLVDQNRVDFVHDRVMVRTLRAMREIELHIVAQVVEAEFVVGAVGNIRAVRLAAFVVVQSVLDHPDAQSKKLVEPAHPFGVTLCQVIVDCDNVDAFAVESIQICRKRRHERFAFTGLHFCDAALMKDNSADKLHVEVPHIESALARFANDCESVRQQVLERLSVLESLLEFGCFGLELFVAEAGNLRF